MFKRLGYTFKYFFDCDVAEMGHIDVEGYDVFNENGELIAELNLFTKDEIDNMSDCDLLNLIEEFGIKVDNVI